MWYHIHNITEGKRKMLTRILIVDGCEEFRMTLSQLLKDRYFLRACRDGTQALAALEDFCPDLMIVDLMLQGIDGLGVIQSARKMGHPAPAVVTSVYFPEYVSNQFYHLNVAYAVCKPCNMDYLAERIEDLVSNVCISVLPVESSYSVTTSALLEMGMIASRAGFKYSRDAILMLEKDPGLMVTKDIYPELAELYSTSATAVEKNIRDAICAVWRATDPAILAKYFIPAANGQIPKPSNHVFLSTVTERLFSMKRMAK